MNNSKESVLKSKWVNNGVQGLTLAIQDPFINVAELPDGKIYKQRRSGPLRESERAQLSMTAEKDEHIQREKKGEQYHPCWRRGNAPSLPQSHTHAEALPK